MGYTRCSAIAMETRSVQQYINVHGTIIHYSSRIETLMNGGRCPKAQAQSNMSSAAGISHVHE